MSKYRDILGVSSEYGTLIAGSFKLEIFDEPGIENMYRTFVSCLNDVGEWIPSRIDFKSKSEIIKIAYMMCLLEGIEYFEGIIFGDDVTEKVILDADGEKIPVYAGIFVSEVGIGDYELTLYKDTPLWSLTFNIEIEEEYDAE
jgi:hypothetical protein